MNKYCFGILAALLLGSCVTEIENPLDLQPQLVINGIFNNSAGQRQMSVFQVEDLDGNGRILDANASLYKDGQLSVELLQNTDGVLELPESYMIEAGAEYYVEISTEGKIYRSDPQVVAPKLETESISFEIFEDVDRPFFRGDPIVRSTIEYFAHVNLPSPETEKRYYRWVVDESWDFHESSQVSDTICYLNKQTTDYTASLLTNASGILQAGEARVSVAIRDFDNSFAETHYFNVYAHALDPKTFEFYAKSDRLTTESGTIYDEIPGPFRGNVSNVDDPEEVVLGWVEFFLADTMRIVTKGEDLRSRNFFVPTQCTQQGEPGPCPPQIPPPGGGLPPPCQCIDCQIVLGLDALNPPEYWGK